MTLARPAICLVTDRHRFLNIDSLIERIRDAARAGVTLIQVREHGLSDRELLALVHRALEATADTGARVLVNERVDIALAANAHGVHLRASSFSAAEARTIAPPGFLIGRSVHAIEEAQAVTRGGGVDYLIAGTVFSSASKPEGHTTLGVGALREIATTVALPVVAIGGINASNIAAIARTGVAGVAAIGWFADEKQPANIVDSVRRAFDTRAQNAE